MALTKPRRPKTKKMQAKKNKKVIKKTIKKPKKVVRKRKKPLPMVNLENVLLVEGRQVFLHTNIDKKAAEVICKQLILLNNIDNKKPILLNINSGGGSVTDGFAIIDTMRTISAPVITVVSGMAASMAGIISCIGYQRIITANSWWMGHEMTCGGYDYIEKHVNRVEWYKNLWSQLTEILKKHTRLSLDEMDKLKRGELWLSAAEAQSKGIADHIV